MKMSQKRGFTLIELLVVIAIIAILAAILFPVFAKAREKARQSACLNNMKQLGVGTRMYMDNNDDTYPMAGLHGQPGWVYSKSDFYFEVEKGQIYPYVKTKDVFVCPSDPLAGQLRVKSPSNVSYSMNGHFGSNSGEDDPWTGLRANQPLTEADVPEPSGTILYLEESQRSADSQGGKDNDGGINDGFVLPGAIGGADKVADFHSGGGNYVMGDTSAKWYSAKLFAPKSPNRKMFWITEPKRKLASEGKL